MRTRNGAGLIALLFVIVAGGCSGAPGKVTLDNVLNNYPPRVLGVDWVVPASVVVVDYQPYDAKRVEVDGWGIYPDADFDKDNVPRVRLYWNLREGLDTQHGRGYFLLVRSDWGDWRGDRPLLASLEHWLLIAVHDPDGERVAVELWRLTHGGASHVRSQPERERVGRTLEMSVVDYRTIDRVTLAQSIASNK